MINPAGQGGWLLASELTSLTLGQPEARLASVAPRRADRDKASEILQCWDFNPSLCGSKLQIDLVSYWAAVMGCHGAVTSVSNTPNIMMSQHQQQQTTAPGGRVVTGGRVGAD